MAAPRRRTRRAALALIGGCAAALAGCQASQSGADGGAAQAVHLRYGQSPSQYAEITLPAGSSQAPVVLIVHGGFWRTGFGSELGQPLAADLADRGFIAVNVEYRRVGVGPGGGGGWPQTGDDIAAAFDALADQGQRLTDGRLDLGRVVALGHSAGGQLAGWLAARGGPLRLSGLVSQAGVLDLVRAADTQLGGGAVEEFIGGTPAALPTAYADASPFARVPLGVPSICVHGRADTIVPLEQSERFVSAAQRMGDRSELRVFDGDHFAPISVGSPAWSLSVDALHDLTAR